MDEDLAGLMVLISDIVHIVSDLIIGDGGGFIIEWGLDVFHDLGVVNFVGEY